MLRDNYLISGVETKMCLKSPAELEKNDPSLCFDPTESCLPRCWIFTQKANNFVGKIGLVRMNCPLRIPSSQNINRPPLFGCSRLTLP